MTSFNPVCQVSLADDFGWQCFTTEYCHLMFKGHFHSTQKLNTQFFSQFTQKIDSAYETDKISKLLLELDGHYAFVYSTIKFTIAVVDRVRSIPLLFAPRDNEGWIISDHAAPMQSVLNLSLEDINPSAAKEIATSGFCTGSQTLYSSVRGLLPGEYVLFDQAREIQPLRYYTFTPWNTKSPSRNENDVQKEFIELTLKVLEKTIESAQGQKILVPLSAGMDSRVILSGFKHLGFKNVTCFSYGRAGNHEASAAKKIAKKLGYDWHFLPTTTRDFRMIRASESYQSYLKKSDTLISTPIEQDVVTLHKMKSCDWAKDGDIVVNGQTGDFISGNHIPTALQHPATLKSVKETEQNLFDAIIAKHFGLWPDLTDTMDKAVLWQQIRKELDAAKVPQITPDNAYAVYEFYEFQNRQAKYVLGNQRGYEHYGFGWRLPLWDKEFVEFWARTPLQYKINQRLYRESMIEANWGGVWTSLLPAPTWVTPAAIRPLRVLGKVACAPLGKAAWHRFEKRFFCTHNRFTQKICCGFLVGCGLNSQTASKRDLMADSTLFGNTWVGLGWINQIYINSGESKNE